MKRVKCPLIRTSSLPVSLDRPSGHCTCKLPSPVEWFQLEGDGRASERPMFFVGVKSGTKEGYGVVSVCVISPHPPERPRVVWSVV